jgi:hypothetical protein
VSIYLFYLQMFTDCFRSSRGPRESRNFADGKGLKVDLLPEKQFTKALKGAFGMEGNNVDSRILGEMLCAQRCSPI